MRNLFLSLFIGLFLMGCAASTPKISTTKSGKPEIVIHKPASFIKPHLISDALDNGYSLVKDSDFLIHFSRKPRAGAESLNAVLTGNKYSERTIELQYTLVETAGKTRVIADYWKKTVFPFGRVKKSSNNGAADFNERQGFFNDLKARLQ